MTALQKRDSISIEVESKKKLYTVTEVYSGWNEFQHIEADSREEAISYVQNYCDPDDCVNSDYSHRYYVEEEEEE